MQWNIKAGIRSARGGDDQVSDDVEFGGLDAEMRQLVRDPERQQTVRPLPHGCGAQKRSRGSVRRHDQYFSSARPDGVGSSGFGGWDA